MAVIKARDVGQIKKRNILKMDKKVNDFICQYLARDGYAHQVTMSEKIAMTGERHLPKPSSEEDTGKTANSSKDQSRWLKNPDDIRDDEKTRMHSFLLLKSDDIPIGTTPFSPVPLTLEATETSSRADNGHQLTRALQPSM